MNRLRPSENEQQPPVNPAAIAAHIPHGLFIMASSFEESCSGTLVQWVQRCCDDPAIVMVSLRRGQPVEPLIRDSRAFSLCQISEDDRFLKRKFAPECDVSNDVFISLSTRSAPSGSPILEHAMSYMDCELLRNVDLDNDYRLYIGQVRHAELLTPARPAMYCGQVNGSH